MIKRIVRYMAVLLICTLPSACQRRPLTTADYAVTLNITIDKDIVNYEYEKDPSLMRCIFYDSQSGANDTKGSVRCIYDEWYWGTQPEARANNIYPGGYEFTWGDEEITW